MLVSPLLFHTPIAALTFSKAFEAAWHFVKLWVPVNLVFARIEEGAAVFWLRRGDKHGWDYPYA